MPESSTEGKPERVLLQQVDYVAEPRWVKIVTQVGFPIFVALWFMGVFDAFLPTQATAHYRLSEAHITESRAQTKSVEEHVRILRMICRNTARDDTQRLACDG